MDDKKTLEKRPKVMEGVTYTYESGCGRLYITINGNSGIPFETFIYSKSGCTGLTEGLARMVSLYLRDGGDVSKIIEQLNNIRCYRATGAPKTNCSKSIAMALKEYVDEHKKEAKDA